MVQPTTAILLEAMQDLLEADLTKNYLIPLFEAMGFTNVEYHGGTDERGKDVLMWDTNKLGRKSLVAVQVKKVQLSGSSSSKEGLARLISQLNQAALEPIQSVDGHSHTAAAVWFVTPYPLTTHALQSHVTGMMLVRERQIESKRIVPAAWSRTTSCATMWLTEVCISVRDGACGSLPRWRDAAASPSTAFS